MQASGVVSRIFKNKTSKPNVYTFAVGLKDAGIYRFGIKDPGVSEGDHVTFEYEEGEYNGKPQLNADARTIKKVTPAATPASPPASTGAKVVAGGGADDKQHTISMQAARNSAVAALQAAIAAGIKLPVGASAKAGQQFDNFMALLDITTHRFYTESVDVAFLADVRTKAKEEATEVTAGSDSDDDTDDVFE